MSPTEREHRPAFGIFVPDDLYWGIVEDCGGPYADSYLYEAVVSNMRVLPWTVTAWERLRDNYAARACFERLGYSLVKPAFRKAQMARAA